MKILILGGDGMLGHQLVRSLAVANDVHATFRGSKDEGSPLAGTVAENSHFDIDAVRFSTIERVAASIRPDVIINSIGLVKQREQANDAIASIEINSLLPHKLSSLADQVGARLIAISTDCVFSGNSGGMYRESDVPDASGMYGRSKLLGEVCRGNAITLRTSIIGLELKRKGSLVEWFLAQKGQIYGYCKAIYSGLTTCELARVIEDIVLKSPRSSGLYHVSSDSISKFDLLCGLRDRLSLGIDILRDEQFENDKSLDSSEFRIGFSYEPPSWDVMLDELALQITERNR